MQPWSDAADEQDVEVVEATPVATPGGAAAQVCQMCGQPSAPVRPPPFSGTASTQIMSSSSKKASLSLRTLKPPRLYPSSEFGLSLRQGQSQIAAWILVGGGGVGYDKAVCKQSQRAWVYVVQ